MRQRDGLLLVFMGYAAGGLLDVSNHHTAGVASVAVWGVSFALMVWAGARSADYDMRVRP